MHLVDVAEDISYCELPQLVVSGQMVASTISTAFLCFQEAVFRRGCSRWPLRIGAAATACGGLSCAVGLATEMAVLPGRSSQRLGRLKLMEGSV